MFVAGCRSSAPRSPAWASATAPRSSSRPGRRPRRPDRSPDHRAPAQPRPARPPYPGRPERPPPPLRRERRPAPPRPRGYVWTNGYWRWPGGRYAWIPGRWIAQRPGHRWIPGCWRQRADVRLDIDGRWNCVRGEPHAVCRESREMHRGTRGGGASPPTNTARPFSAQRFVERPCAPARAGDEPATRQTRGHAGGGPRIPPDGAD
ncbi:YXWGXW repeat-containing protein [Burkholderia pseudomallei]|uniref:YXWGXW repeat-containing protein n=1 Tax=Burkholderia pseudomallei TaxID=28450 RepID=UPI001F424908|nr:YXWGXW repeat-containing protein [Burkholderia pseudomallei]